MIGVLGVKSQVKLDEREKLSILPKHYDDFLQKLKEICSEVVILSTCNRTEVYFNTNLNREDIILNIFKKLNWDENCIKYTFFYEEEDMVNHLMEVICGFDSLIYGEDQILAQIKSAYEVALNTKSVKNQLQKLFQMAITCGKEFRCESKLYKIPVSSASIAVNEGRRHKCKSFMILGYGEVGKLATKYVLSGSFDNLYIAVRNTNVVDIDDPRVKVIHFNERQDYYKDVECIISCTSAPHVVISASELSANPLVIYDLAVPRDVEDKVMYKENVKLYDIDAISCMNDENCQKREDIMNNNIWILKKYIQEFLDWREIRKISSDIISLREKGKLVSDSRYKTFKNKQQTKDNNRLAKILIESTSNAYINKAIDVLKEEQLKGRGKECLEIIKKIFYSVK